MYPLPVPRFVVRGQRYALHKPPPVVGDDGRFMRYELCARLGSVFQSKLDERSACDERLRWKKRRQKMPGERRRSTNVPRVPW